MLFPSSLAMVCRSCILNFGYSSCWVRRLPWLPISLSSLQVCGWQCLPSLKCSGSLNSTYTSQKGCFLSSLGLNLLGCASRVLPGLDKVAEPVNFIFQGSFFSPLITLLISGLDLCDSLLSPCLLSGLLPPILVLQSDSFLKCIFERVTFQLIIFS